MAASECLQRLRLGTETCGKYPGSAGYESVDAASMAAWGADYMKYDECNTDPLEQELFRFFTMRGYPPAATSLSRAPLYFRWRFPSRVYRAAHKQRALPPRGYRRDAMNATGRPMIYTICPAQSRCDGTPRARSHYRFVPPSIYFIPDSRTYPAPLFLRRQCDRT